MRSNDMTDDEMLRQYLLGALNEEQEDAIEGRLLKDGDLFELAEAVEGDLLAAAARGDLSAAERGRVLRRLAGSTEGRARYALARSLVSMDREPVPAEVRMFRFAAKPWVRAAVAAASVAFVAGGLWLGTHPFQDFEHLADRMPPVAPSLPPPSPDPPVVIAEQDLTPPVPPATEPEPIAEQEPAEQPEPASWPLPLALVSSSVRSAGEGIELPEFNPPETGRIEIQISLEEGEPATSFVAILRNLLTGEEIQRTERLAAREMNSRKVLSLSLPAADLVPGRYEVEVQGEEVGLVGTSTFTVASN